MRRSTVLNLPLQLVFPDYCGKKLCEINPRGKNAGASGIKHSMAIIIDVL
jgi:hypothetical protein